jgi:hypothetical protein
MRDVACESMSLTKMRNIAFSYCYFLTYLMYVGVMTEVTNANNAHEIPPDDHVLPTASQAESSTGPQQSKQSP